MTTKPKDKKRIVKRKIKKPRRSKLGRPTGYSQEIADEICRRIISGDSLRTICADKSMPCASSVLLWLQVHVTFSLQYRKAREEQANALADELLDIADNSTNDYMEKERPDGSSYVALDAENINRSKLRIHTRQWILERMKPKVYGPRQSIEHTGKDGEPIEFKNTGSMSNEDLMKALNSRLTNND